MKQIFLLVASLLVTSIGFAKIPKPMKNTYVNDFAEVLTPAEIRVLNSKIHRIERLSSVQVAIVLISKLPADYDIEEYALLIGRKWHVGKNNDGLVYVAAIQQHKQRLEVARLLTHKLTDERCGEILNVIKPFYRQQDYNGGLNAMVDEITSIIIPPAHVSSNVPTANSHQLQQHTAINHQSKNNSSGIAIVVIICAVILLIILIIRRSHDKKNNYQQQVNNYNGGYSNGYGTSGGNYNSPSGLGTALGGFAAGYATRAIQDNLSHYPNDSYHHRNYGSSYDAPSNFADVPPDAVEDREVNISDQDSSDWGNWGGDSNSSSSDSDSTNSSDSSSNNGYDGGSGATSDW